MWKVTPVGMKNACCAGARLVANANELAACGNPVPATAPRWYICACANTRSLFNSLRWFILAATQIATCRRLQLGICKGCRGAAQGLMAQPHRCQPESWETSAAVAELGSLLIASGGLSSDRSL